MGWASAWDSEHLLPVFWNFTSENGQNPEKFIKIFGKDQLTPDNSRETQITAMCWGLVWADSALFNRAQCPLQGGKVSVTESKVAEFMAEPENQPVPVSSALVCKEKHWKPKWTHLVRDEGSKRDQEADYSKIRLSQEEDKEDRQLSGPRTHWGIEEEMQYTNGFVNEGQTYHGHYPIPCTISSALKVYYDRKKLELMD